MDVSRKVTGWLFVAVGAALACLILGIANGGAQADITIERPWEPIGLARVSLEATSADLGHDRERIYAYVRDKLRFEPYAGVLRGARGVLIAQGGNSVDQALLLHDLLTRAGFACRYAHARISEQRAAALVASSLEVERNDTTAMDAADEKQLDALADRILEQYAQLTKALVKSGVGPPDHGGDMARQLIAALRDHWWIQVRDGDRWIDLDPTVAAASANEMSGTETVSEIPANLYHRINLFVRAEIPAGNKLESRTLLSLSDTASALSYETLFLIHRPDEWAGPASLTTIGRSAGSVWDSVTASRKDQIRPVLLRGGEYTLGDAYLRFDPAAASAPAKPPSIFDIGNMIEGTPTTAAANALWVDVEFVSPDGTSTMVRRTLFDRVAYTERQHGRIKPSDAPFGYEDPIDAIYAMSFYSGPILHPDVLAVPDKVGRRTVVASDNEVALFQLNSLLAATNNTMAAVAERFALPLRVQGGHAVFEPLTPRLLISGLHTSDKTVTLTLDLRHAAFAPVSDGIEDRSFYLRIFKGVLDGVLEDALMTELAGTGAEPAFKMRGATTARVFQKARAQGIEPLVLRPSSGNALPVTWPAEARGRIQAALAQQKIVVVPSQPVVVSGQPQLAWWTVDRNSGRTTAVMQNGLHGDTEEYTIVLDHEKNISNIYMHTRGKALLYRFTEAERLAVTKGTLTEWAVNGQIRKVVLLPPPF